MKQLNKWQWSTLILSAILVMAFSVFIYRYEPFKSGFEITDQLGGNIFPATILSTATTDVSLIVPADSDYIGNPKSCIAIRLKNSYANSKLRIEVAETPFFSQSVSCLLYTSVSSTSCQPIGYSNENQPPGEMYFIVSIFLIHY